jgi:acyl-CoA synthetase (AMP-forming)/AMP-acid ligase II/serine acetyltransferase
MKQPFTIRGDITGIVARNSVRYVDAVLACLEAGTTVVPLRAVDDDERAGAAGVTTRVTPDAGHGWIRRSFTARASEDIAQISFTSGTEGTPKGVLLSHRALADVQDRLRDTMALTGEVREYVGVPVYHSFGYARCRAVCGAGGQLYIPEHGFNPVEIAEMLAGGHINALSAVPTQLRILLQNQRIFGAERDRLRWIEIGSQPMSWEEKRALRELFPEACILQHYGLTEASRTTFLLIDQVSTDRLDSVGTPTGDVRVRIDADGRIQIQGPHLASGLLIRGEYAPLPGADGWLATSDLGRIEDGFLYFEGRADNVINCGGQKISAETIEAELARRLGISSGVAVARLPDALYGEAVLIGIDPTCGSDRPAIQKAAEAILADGGIAARGAVRLIECDRLPATSTGKIVRNELVALYRRGEPASAPPTVATPPPPRDARERLIALFRDTFKDPAVSGETSLTTVGADSLLSVRIALGIEEAIGHLPRDWRTLTIDQLAKQERPRPQRAGPTAAPEPHARRRAAPLPRGTTNENPPGIGFWALVREDLATHDADPFSQGFWAVFCNRFGNWRMGLRFKLLRAPMTLVYRVLRKFVQVFCGIKLDYTVKLGRRVKLEHFGGMIIGARQIGDDVIIRQNTTMGIRDMSDLSAKPTIEEGVNIGAGAVIVGDIVVGRHSIIGANAVVDTDVPPFSTVTAPACTIVTRGTGGTAA